VTKRSAYNSKPVLVPSDKQNISTKQSAYQNTYFFTLHPHFVQNKYVPHTINLHPLKGLTGHPKGVGEALPHSLRTADLVQES
jgi:hypothetical protein